jgi:DNA helicase HerA-like ATPase
MPIDLGKTEHGKPVRLDIERLVSTRMLLQANSGGGKSWAIRRLLEQSHGLVQHLVMDPEGEFYTLREKFERRRWSVRVEASTA